MSSMQHKTFPRGCSVRNNIINILNGMNYGVIIEIYLFICYYLIGRTYIQKIDKILIKNVVSKDSVAFSFCFKIFNIFRMILYTTTKISRCYMYLILAPSEGVGRFSPIECVFHPGGVENL